MNIWISNIGLSLLSAIRPLPKETSSEDFIMASYPKSGNTWLRFMFAHLSANAGLGSEEVDFHTIERYSPAVGGRFMPFDPLPLKAGVSRAIKTHYNFSFRYASHRSLLLVRDPLKCLPAHYDYLSSAHGVQFSNLSDFLYSPRHGLPAWVSFHNSWRRHVDFVLRYEDVLAKPEYWIGQLVEHLRLPYTPREIEIALERSSREEMKKAEIKGDPYHNSGYTFVRGENEVRETLEFSTHERDIILSIAYPTYLALSSGPRTKSPRQ